MTITKHTCPRGPRIGALLVACLLTTVLLSAEYGGTGPEPTPSAISTPAATQAGTAKPEPKPRLDLYGFAMLDMGYQPD